MNRDLQNIKPDWQPLADRLSAILGREIIPGQKYQRVDEREFWVSSGGRTTTESIGVALPPYTEDDLDAIDFEWTGLPTSSPVWAAPQWLVARARLSRMCALANGVASQCCKGAGRFTMQ